MPIFKKAVIKKKLPELPKTRPLKAKPVPDRINDTPLTISVDEMGRRLGICRKTAFKVAHQPGFPSVRIGGRLMVNYPAFQQWVEKRTAMENQ